jgi:hypothetical protein
MVFPQNGLNSLFNSLFKLLPKKTKKFCCLQKPSMMQAHNMRVAENCVIHVDRSEKSVINKDRAAQVLWMTGVFRPPPVSGLRHAWLFF